MKKLAAFAVGGSALLPMFAFADFDGDIFASSTSIVTGALEKLTTNYLAFAGIVILVAMGFFFLWKIVRKSKKAVH